MAHTPEQQRMISDLIRDSHLAFIVRICGPTAIAAADYQRLKAAGRIVLPTKPVDPAAAAVIVGALTGASAKPKTTPVGGTFYSIAQTRMGLTPQETEAIAYARSSVATAVTGLGNRLDTKTQRLLIDADASARAAGQARIREVVAEGLSQRETTRQIATRLGNIFNEAHRDCLMIATTEVHTATEEGKAAALEAQYPGDPLVYKRPRPTACPFCRLLYLEGDVPRVFRLSDLRRNGTNEGRRRARPTLIGPHQTQWRPVLGAVHPWCGCTLHLMPDGYTFDIGGSLVPGSPQIVTLNKSLTQHECT